MTEGKEGNVPPCIIQVAFDPNNPYNAVPLDVLEHMVSNQHYLDALTNVARNYLTATHYVRKEMERQLPPTILSSINEMGGRILKIEENVQTLINRGTGDDTFSESEDFIVVASDDSTLSGDPEEYNPPMYCPGQYVESPEWPGYDSE
jgi:hypothetical protein